MQFTRTKLLLLAGSTLALGFAAGIAVGQMKPPAESKGISADQLRALDLTGEIDSVRGRPLRMRRITLLPGGVIGLHSHKDRPALIYTLSGSITEYSSTCGAPIEHKAGDISREADGLSHYWVNHGKVATVLLSSDVFHGK